MGVENMDEKVLFKFNIVKHNDSDIQIKGYFYLNNDLYDEMTLFISPKTIPALVKVLSNKGGIENETINDVIDNGYDHIEFAFRGSDLRPTFTIVSDHKLENGKIDEGIIDIPLDLTGLDDMKYITPLAEELKKYIS